MNDGKKEVPFALRQNHANMDLRDYFAAAALQGTLASDKAMNIVLNAAKNEGPIKKIVARIAYDYADAMLAQREKTG